MSFMDAREFGSKPGSGGAASHSSSAIDRRERLRRLALETIDVSTDPYFMRNHLGKYECRLCLTIHNNEGNYLAHTQGKRHQTNLAKRAIRDREESSSRSGNNALSGGGGAGVQVRKSSGSVIKIGRPAYRVTKQYNKQMKQKALLFQIEYPEISLNSSVSASVSADMGTKQKAPRHRYMSCYEQKKEKVDRRYQYLLFAAEPYEVIGFKVRGSKSYSSSS